MTSTSRQDLDEFLSPYSAVSSLQLLGAVSINLYKRDAPFIPVTLELTEGNRPSFLSQSSLAYVAHRAIVAAKSVGGRAFGPSAVAHAVDMHYRMEDQLELLANLRELSVEDALAMFGRMSFDQLAWQDGREVDDIVRTWMILESCRTRNQSGRLLDVDGVLRKIAGVDVAQVMALGIMLFTQVMSHGPMFRAANITNYLEKVGGATLSGVHLHSLLRSMSIAIGLARLQGGSAPSLPRGLEKYATNPLEAHPLICHGSDLERDSLLVPCLPLLLRRLSGGLLWSLRDFFRTSVTPDEFMITFGHAFSDYCGQLLRSAFGADHVRDVRVDDGRSKEKGADWIAYQGGHAFVFECKAAILTRALRQTFYLCDIREWLCDRVAKGVAQLGATLDKVRREDGVHHADGVLVLFDDMGLDEVPVLGKWSRNVIREKLGREVDFHVMRVKELEQMEEPIQTGLLATCLERRRDFVNADHYFFEGNLMAAPRLTAIAHKLGSGLRQNACLRRQFHEYWRQMFPWIAGADNR